jgi:D-erythronate 2-dehydrogenase
MNVLLTGADGYIGRALAKRLCEAGTILQGQALNRLTLCDLRLEKPRATIGCSAWPAASRTAP